MGNMVNYSVNEDVITVHLPDSINIQNAKEYGEGLCELPVTDQIREIVLDASDLEFISSAGLRALIHFSKVISVPFHIKEVSSSVYDIFNMTGVVELLKIEKALRYIDIKELKELGRGMYGAVYKVDNETVLKVFYGVTSQETLSRILHTVRTAFVKNIPTIIPFDTVKTDQGLGMVFELLNSECLADLIHRDPGKMDVYVRKMVEIARLMADTEFEEGSIQYRNDMMKEELEAATYLFTPEEKAELMRYVDAVPKRRTAVHGDFHARNIYMSDDSALMIDMDDFSLGHPVWDIACLYRVYPYLISLAQDPDTARQLFGLDGSIAYSDFYYRVMHLSLDEGAALWESFLEYYFEGYSKEEKKHFLEIAKFYSDYMLIRYLIDQCAKVKDEPDKMEDKLSLIHSILAEMRKQDLDKLIRVLELWR